MRRLLGHRLLSHRDARIYLAGQILSVLGDSALWLAMGIWVKQRTGSNSAAGLVFFAFICGTCLAPLAGLLVDRVRRRPLLITVNLGAAALVCLLLLSGGPRLWLIYPVMFGYGAAYSLLSSAQTALLPRLLPDDLLGAANSAYQTASSGLHVITPLLGAGLLVWAGPEPVIGLDAATFVLAAAAAWALRLRDERPVRGADPPLAAVTAGLRHIAATPPLRRVVAAIVIAASVFGFFETVQFAVVGGIHRSPAFLGVLTAAQGGGAVAGGVLAAPVLARASERLLVGSGLLACALSCVAAATGWLALVLAGGALLGLCIVWINVGAITLIQRQTPARLLGRVDAAANVLVTVPQAVSIAVGAAAIAVLDYRILLAVMAAVMLAAAGYLARVPASMAGTATRGIATASNRVQR